MSKKRRPCQAAMVDRLSKGLQVMALAAGLMLTAPAATFGNHRADLVQEYKLLNPGIPIAVVPLKGRSAFFFCGGRSTYGVAAGMVSSAGIVREYFIHSRYQIESAAVAKDGTLWATTL